MLLYPTNSAARRAQAREAKLLLRSAIGSRALCVADDGGHLQRPEEEARRVACYYELRWRIENYYKTWKSGVGVE